MSTLKKILLGIFVVLAVVYLFIIVSPRLFKGFYPFGIKTAVVMTGSMVPTVEIDDFVILEKPGEIEEGQIVSYEVPGDKNEVLHRVVEVDGDKVITKGDANNVEDDPITKDQITGVYVGKIKFLGNFISFITKPIVFGIVMVLLLIWVLMPSKKDHESRKGKVKNEKA